MHMQICALPLAIWDIDADSEHASEACDEACGDELDEPCLIPITDSADEDALLANWVTYGYS